MEPQTVSQQPKFVRWALLLGIVIILNVFFNVVLALAYPAPVYEDYCPQQNVTPTDAATCDAQGGIWTEYPPAPATDASSPKFSGYCDLYAKCQVPFKAAQDQHALYAFVLMVGLGIVALVAGFMPLGSSIVSSGLSYGGVLALIIGSAEYWGTAGNWIRLLISTAGLVALLFIGWRRFRD
jgi:hypothetical protein